jgi:hypothetical protein
VFIHRTGSRLASRLSLPTSKIRLTVEYYNSLLSLDGFLSSMELNPDMTEKSREDRFDEVFQMVLIVVALSFDILWRDEKVPIAEIVVFIYVLTFWAYGNLKGGIWEYPLKVGSFNLSITLMTNFYIAGIYGDLALLGLWEMLFTIVVLPTLCLLISLVLVSYLKESVENTIALPVLIGGTLGYVFSLSALLFLGV